MLALAMLGMMVACLDYVLWLIPVVDRWIKTSLASLLGVILVFLLDAFHLQNIRKVGLWTASFEWGYKVIEYLEVAFKDPLVMRWLKINE